MINTAVRQQTPPANQPPAPWSALQRAATKVSETPDEVHIDGVRWDIVNKEDGTAIEEGVFSDAFFKPDKVKDVFLCIKPFTDQPMNAPGHALLSFEFDKENPVHNSQGQTDSSLVLSVEVHFHQGEQYNPDSKNPILYQFGTWPDAIEKATVYDHYPLHKYKLDLNHDQQVALLKNRIEAGTANHDNDIYDAINNSCLSTLIDGVNAIVPEPQQIPRVLPDGSPDPSGTVPVWCPNTFKAHGLMSQPKPDIIPGVPKPTPPPSQQPPATLLAV